MSDVYDVTEPNTQTKYVATVSKYIEKLNKLNFNFS